MERKQYRENVKEISGKVRRLKSRGYQSSFTLGVSDFGDEWFYGFEAIPNGKRIRAKRICEEVGSNEFTSLT